MKKKITYVPCTPAGTLLSHLESSKRDRAIRKLLNEASHMPYGNWQGFKERGYRIVKIKGDL